MNPHRRSPFITLAAVLVFVFLYAPIFVLVIYSFNASKANVKFEGFIPSYGSLQVVNGDVTQSPCGPFHWFCELSKNREVINAARNTLTIAFSATLVSTIIGTMAALALQRYDFKLKRFSQISLYIPIVIPEIVMGIGILLLFSTLFRWINPLLQPILDQLNSTILAWLARTINETLIDGANSTVLALINHSLGWSLHWDPLALMLEPLALGLGTVILAHIAFMIPFVTLVVQARLQGFDKSYEEAAMDLGADEWTTFRRVTFPMIFPGVLSGALLAFTLSLDDFVITFFTNGPGSTTLPIYVYGLLRRIITPQVNALSTVWITIVFIVVLFLQWVQSRED